MSLFPPGQIDTLFSRRRAPTCTYRAASGTEAQVRVLWSVVAVDQPLDPNVAGDLATVRIIKQELATGGIDVPARDDVIVDTDGTEWRVRDIYNAEPAGVWRLTVESDVRLVPGSGVSAWT